MLKYSIENRVLLYSKFIQKVGKSMRKILLAGLSVGLLLMTQGCHTLKKREQIDVAQTLFVNVDKVGNSFSVKNITHDSGDVNLKIMALSSPASKMKLCGSLEDERCFDKVLDAVETTLDRKSLLLTYNHLMAKNSEHKKALETIYQRFSGTYESDSKKINLRYLINDQTNLYKGEKLPFKDLLHVGLNDLKYPQKTLYQSDIDNLFPHTIDAFQSDVRDLTDSLDESYAKDLSIYKRTIRKRSSFYPLVRRSSMKEGLFTLKVQAPERVDRKREDTVRVIFHILGKDMHAVYPPRWEGKNRHLKVTLNKQSTTFTNLSHKRLSLKSITFFYNGYNQTTLLGRDFSFSALDAKATTSTPSTIFLTKRFKQAAFFPGLSQSKAQNRKVEFGIEVKYKVEGKTSSDVFMVSKKEILWRYITGW